MAVEVSDLSPAEPSIKAPISLEKWRNKDRVVNEFNNKETPVLKPLKSVKIEVDAKNERGEPITKEIDFDPLIQKDFAYYSRTRELEVNTPRTQLLQNLVDKMTVGTDIQTRVVIMNKGKESSAFVTPDGTIFISQSVINSLNSMDEIGAILAHEVGHLYFKTFERKVKASGGSIGEVSVSWIHEGVSDSIAKDFGEKAGLNTFAFGTAIEKIAGANRGLEHQGGYMRSSQNVAEHSAKHYETSAKAVEPIPIMLLRRVNSTNSEIITDKIEHRRQGHIKDDLAKLHPRDLEEAYKKCLAKTAYDYEWARHHPDYYQESFKLLGQFNELLNDRLVKAGFSKAQILTWFVTQSHNNLYLFKDLEDTVKVADTFVEASAFSEGKTELSKRDNYFTKISQSVFEKGYNFDQLTVFLLLLKDSLYDQSSGPIEGRIPVNRQTILEILSKFSKLELGMSEKENMGRVVEKYIEESFYKNACEAGEDIDTAQIVDFLDEAKEKGVNIGWEFVSGLTRNAEDKINHLWSLPKGDIRRRNYEKVIETFKNYFGQKDWEPFTDINQEIDTFSIFFHNFPKNEYQYTRDKKFEEFLSNLRKTFDHQQLDDASRDEFIRRLSSKFDNWSGFTKYSLRKTLQQIPGQDIREVIDLDENERLAKLMIKTTLGIALFKGDGKEFYNFLNEILKDSALDFSSFSNIELVNLYSSLFLSAKGRAWKGFSIPTESHSDQPIFLNEYVRISDFEKMTNFSPISEIINNTEKEDLSTFEKLRISVEGMVHRLNASAIEASNFSNRSEKDKSFDIFSDNPLSLILFRNHRQAFLNLMNKGVNEEDLGSLYETLTALYPAESNRENFLRAIQKRFLLSKTVSLDQKTDYLLTNIERLGPEGILMLADQITTLNDYQKFRERLGDKLEGYLNGGVFVAKSLAGDLVTSQLSDEFEKVIQTTIDDPVSVEKTSTDFAKSWFDHNLNLRNREQQGYVRYDPEEKRFITGDKSRITFRSITDAFSLFKNLTHSQRFLILHKALADVKGALSTSSDRQTLADLTTRSLKLTPGFVNDVVRSACLVGEPRLISFPAANMLSPMLFRGLDTKKINIDEVLKTTKAILEGDDARGFSNKLLLKDFLTIEDTEKIINSTTRQLTVFGADFIRQPNSFFFKTAQQSDLVYQQLTDSLETQLLRETNGVIESGSEVNANIEAVIKGVEASGALGVRSLQLATQLLKFSPDVTKRLSHSFDSNPGMRKMIFWERLYQQGQTDPQLLSFLNSMEIGDYLGGGSLFTTYAARRLDSETGQWKDIVVKALNTNAEGFIEQYYSMATKVLSQVEKNGGNRNMAKAARLLLDISREWCKADIHDTFFAIDDDNFQKTIQVFNSASGRDAFYAPKREFSNVHIKVEDLAKGPTLNKFLNNDKVKLEQKKEMVSTLMKFFAFQFKQTVKDQYGQESYLFHSDPHPGNYIVSNGENDPKLAVIDRSMYLKLKKEDLGVLQNLLTEQNPTKFVNQFVGRVLDEKGVTNNIQRRKVWFQVWSALTKEMGAQVIKGKVDNFSLLRTMFSELDNSGFKVPLNLRLMIRNIGAFKELGQQYGLKLEDYFKA